MFNYTGLGMAGTNLQGLGQLTAGDWIDPATGMLKRQPNAWDPNEMQAAKAAMQQYQNEQAQAGWQNQWDLLEKSFKTPAIDTEGIINKGTEELSEGQRSAARGLRRNAVASGMAGSGGQAAGLRALDQDFAGKRANLARDVRLSAAGMQADAEQKRLGMQMDLLRRKPALGGGGLSDLGGGGAGGEHYTGWSIGAGHGTPVNSPKSKNASRFVPGAPNAGPGAFVPKWF